MTLVMLAKEHLSQNIRLTGTDMFGPYTFIKTFFGESYRVSRSLSTISSASRLCIPWCKRLSY